MVEIDVGEDDDKWLEIQERSAVFATFDHGNFGISGVIIFLPPLFDVGADDDTWIFSGVDQHFPDHGRRGGLPVCSGDANIFLVLEKISQCLRIAHFLNFSVCCGLHFFILLCNCWRIDDEIAVCGNIFFFLSDKNLDSFFLQSVSLTGAGLV